MYSVLNINIITWNFFLILFLNKYSTYSISISIDDSNVAIAAPFTPNAGNSCIDHNIDIHDIPFDSKKILRNSVPYIRPAFRYTFKRFDSIVTYIKTLVFSIMRKSSNVKKTYKNKHAALSSIIVLFLKIQ